MRESIGELLRETRIGKNLELEDASRDTKIRPRILHDLENDDYSNFASLVYARGFLKKYASYLGVDATPFLERLDTQATDSSENFQFLTFDPKPDLSAARPAKKQGSRVLGTLLISALAVVIVATALYIKTSWERIYPKPESTTTQPETVSSQQPDVNHSSTPDIQSPTAAAADTVPEDSAVEPQTTDLPDDKPIMRALPVNGSAPPLPPGPEHSITIRATEKTWVKVIKMLPVQEVIYDDWLEPDDQELNYLGQHFRVTIMNMERVEILHNGNPVAINSTAIEIK